MAIRCVTIRCLPGDVGVGGQRGRRSTPGDTGEGVVESRRPRGGDRTSTPGSATTKAVGGIAGRRLARMAGV